MPPCPKRARNGDISYMPFVQNTPKSSVAGHSASAEGYRIISGRIIKLSLKRFLLQGEIKILSLFRISGGIYWALKMSNAYFGFHIPLRLRLFLK